MKIVAGLGNPGKRYENTRHNLGFRVIDILAGKMGVSVIKAKHGALTGDKVINSEKVNLIKPMNFMNLSGQSVKSAMDYYKCTAEDIIIIYDDCSLPAGSVRVRERGSDGGHNGLKNIIAEIGSQDFIRVRIGIGEKPPEWDLADYVLSGFSDGEKPEIEKAVNDAADCVTLILSGRIKDAMNKYNRRAAEAANTQQKPGGGNVKETGEKNE